MQLKTLWYSAFNVNNLEQVTAMEAANEVGAPVIVKHLQVRVVCW